MILLTEFTPFIRRKEQPQGTDASHSSYSQSNTIEYERIGPKDAPDPIRYGRTPARPAQQYIAIMSTRPADYGYGINQAFVPYNRYWLPMREMLVGRQNQVLAMNELGVRPNIVRPPAYAYGSLFGLGQEIYQ